MNFPGSLAKPEDSLWQVAEKLAVSRSLKTAQMQGARQWAPPEGWVFERSEEKPRGARRTLKYVAATRDEGNAADERFSATC
jgi:hypothetical protein